MTRKSKMRSCSKFSDGKAQFDVASLPNGTLEISDEINTRARLDKHRKKLKEFESRQRGETSFFLKDLDGPLEDSEPPDNDGIIRWPSEKPDAPPPNLLEIQKQMKAASAKGPKNGKKPKEQLQRHAPELDIETLKKLPENHRRYHKWLKKHPPETHEDWIKKFKADDVHCNRLPPRDPLDGYDL